MSDKIVYEYVAFTPDRARNGEELRKGLVAMHPDWVGAVPKNDKLDEMANVLPDDTLFLSSAELYPDGAANVFVKSAAGTPAIGFIRVRRVQSWE